VQAPQTEGWWWERQSNKCDKACEKRLATELMHPTELSGIDVPTTGLVFTSTKPKVHLRPRPQSSQHLPIASLPESGRHRLSRLPRHPHTAFPPHLASQAGDVIKLVGNGLGGGYCAMVNTVQRRRTYRVKCNKGHEGMEFTLIGMPSGHVALKPNSNGRTARFCSARPDDSEGGGITCDANNIRSWEKFSIAYAGQNKSGQKGTRWSLRGQFGYCTDESDSRGFMKCNRKGVGSWEQFSVQPTDRRRSTQCPGVDLGSWCKSNVQRTGCCGSVQISTAKWGKKWATNKWVTHPQLQRPFILILLKHISADH
jgi:hypothetical protein